VAISWKWWEIGPKSLLITNRKWHTPFQLNYKSSILDDLEGHWQSVWSAILATAELLVTVFWSIKVLLVPTKIQISSHSSFCFCFSLKVLNFWEIQPQSLLIINRKWHTPFQLNYKSSILDDLEGHWQSVWLAILATAELLVSIFWSIKVLNVLNFWDLITATIKKFFEIVILVIIIICVMMLMSVYVVAVVISNSGSVIGKSRKNHIPRVGDFNEVLIITCFYY